MPTPEVTGTAASLCEEIKSIAHEYGVLLAKDIPLSNCLKNEVINSTEDYIVDFLQHLSKTHCIVPKEEIYMRHGVALALMEQDPSHKEFYRGQSSVLESIFGKSLFNEEKE